LITAELLLANGCRVIGFDFDAHKVQLAREKGVHAFDLSAGTDPVKAVLGLTEGVGADAVLITASTKSNEVVAQAAQMSRKRGRIVLVGVVGLQLNRADFYEKELSFQVSCSYGPGRYDEDYEKRGHDYPLPFVRWTENRNFQTILEAISTGKLDVKRLITEEVALEEYEKIYGNIGNKSTIASILTYKAQPDDATAVRTGVLPAKEIRGSNATLAIIGAGNFTKMTMLPALSGLKANIKYIVSASGVSGTHLAKKHGIAYSATAYEDTLRDPDVGAVLITTQHNLHADMVTQALQAGKHVFVEKPLVISEGELARVLDAYRQGHTSIMVGFNRRFSPFISKAKMLLGAGAAPMNIVITANAGAIPATHWTQNMAIGGGRIIGEACHFIDLVAYLTGRPITEVMASALGTHPARSSDNVSMLLKCADGSQGVVNYFSNGHKSYPKERIEIYSQGRVLVVDNFRKLEAYGFRSGAAAMRGKQDKGHKAQFEAYLTFLKKGGAPPIPFEQILNTTLATFAAVKAFESGEKITLNNIVPPPPELASRTA
jgi:predicted dehydrogenase